jgi:hypothetical protein
MSTNSITRAGDASIQANQKNEASTGFEPVMELLQSPALPLGYDAVPLI